MTKPTEYLRVSYSSLNTFDSCNRKFEFNKLYPRKVRDQDMFAADVGKALHAGYQEYLTSKSEDSAIWAFLREYPYRLEFMQEKDDRSCEASLSTLVELLDSYSLYEYELARIMRPATPAELAVNPTVLKYDAPAIEVPFEIRFKGITLPDGRGIAYTGFIDAILRNMVNGLYRTMDIKTHRRQLKDATGKYKFDAQQVPYGIVVDHIAGQPVEDFDVLYLDAYVDLLEPRVAMYPFRKDREDMQEWLLGTVMKLQQIQKFMELDHFPRTQGGCLFYNKPCFFLEACSSRDRNDVMQWLLMGEEAAPERITQPWIIADIDVFAEG